MAQPSSPAPRKTTWAPPEHTHPAVDEGCPGCLHRFGTVIATTAELSSVLNMAKLDDDPLVAVLIQLVWTVNRNLDRIATAVEKQVAA